MRRKTTWKNYIKAIASVILASVSTSVFAQEEEAPVGFGFELGVSKELPKGFDIGLEGEIHTCKDFSMLEHYCFVLHGGYNITSWLHGEIGYQFMNLNAEDRSDFTPKNWRDMHRVFAGLEASHSIQNLNISLTERYDYTFQPSNHILRSKLLFDYDIPQTPLCAFASFEILNDICRSFKSSQEFYRIGLEWAISDNHTLELSGGFNSKDFQEEERGHIIEIGYELAF